MKTKRLIAELICAALLLTLPFMAFAETLVRVIPVSTNGRGDNLVITQAGDLWAWDGGAPEKILDGAVAASAGDAHALAVTKDGGLYGWGSNAYGQLGLGKDTASADKPVKIMDGVAFAAASGLYSYVVKNDGSLWAFGGDKGSGKYLIGDGTEASPTPVKVLDGVTLVSAAGSNVLALKADGSLWIWGDNASGELGDGTTSPQNKPVKVMDDVATAAMGEFHTLAVKKDGTLWAWGSNYGGVLGDGTEKDSSTPVKIMDGVVSVAAGLCHSLAVKKDGGLWSWGQGVNSFKGEKGYNPVPEKIAEDVVFTCAKQSTDFAVKSDGSLWAWGELVNLGSIYSTPFPTEAFNGVQLPGVSFTDVAADAWYYKAVSFIAARGVTDGTGNGQYSPEAKLTRGEFIVMMMKAYGIAPDENPTDNFSDAGNTYYTGYLAAAKRLGITNGVGNNIYAPDKEITRQEMFTMLYNALRVIGQLPGGDSGKTLSDFTDAEQIDAWAKEAMTLMVKTGTVCGSNGKLTPQGITTRAEMAQVLYNLLGK